MDIYTAVNDFLVWNRKQKNKTKFWNIFRTFYFPHFLLILIIFNFGLCSFHPRKVEFFEIFSVGLN